MPPARTETQPGLNPADMALALNTRTHPPGRPTHRDVRSPSWPEEVELQEKLWRGTAAAAVRQTADFALRTALTI